MSRRKGRELAVQMLFQHDLAETPQGEVKQLFWECHPNSKTVREFAEFLFEHAVANLERIDSLIGSCSHNWRLERMASVDRNTLRIAVAEVLYSDTPRAILIDEAVEIARKFGTEKSSDFVNGILDAIAEQVERSPHD